MMLLFGYKGRKKTLINFVFFQSVKMKCFVPRDSCWYAPVALKQSLKFIPVSWKHFTNQGIMHMTHFATPKPSQTKSQNPKSQNPKSQSRLGWLYYHKKPPPPPPPPPPQNFQNGRRPQKCQNGR